MVAALVLPAMAQFGKQQQPNDNQFRSTSTMVGTGSTYSANPTINAGGTANAPTYGGGEPSGPYKTPDPLGDQGAIDDNPWGSGFDAPLGDAVLPLLLCAAAFAAFLALRRRKARI